VLPQGVFLGWARREARLVLGVPPDCTWSVSKAASRVLLSELWRSVSGVCLFRGLRKRERRTMPAQRFETIAQACERTGLSRNTLRRRIATGELPAFMAGRRILRAPS